MEIGEEDVKKVFIIVIFAAVAVLSFFIIQPILYAIVIGLILAYLFAPVYKWIYKKTN